MGVPLHGIETRLMSLWYRMPASIELNIAVLGVSLTLGLFVGVLAAANRGKIIDIMSRVGIVLADAVPVFWLSLMLILAFGAPGLDILPMGSRCEYAREGCGPIYERLDHLILPTLALAIGNVAFFATVHADIYAG